MCVMILYAGSVWVLCQVFRAVCCKCSQRQECIIQGKSHYFTGRSKEGKHGYYGYNCCVVIIIIRGLSWSHAGNCILKMEFHLVPMMLLKLRVQNFFGLNCFWSSTSPPFNMPGESLLIVGVHVWLCSMRSVCTTWSSSLLSLDALHKQKQLEKVKELFSHIQQLTMEMKVTWQLSFPKFTLPLCALLFCKLEGHPY